LTAGHPAFSTSSLQRQGFAKALFERAGIVVRTLVQREMKAVSPYCLMFLDRLVEASDQSRDQHDHADANTTPNTVSALRSVRAERIHRLFQVFAVCWAMVP
jgi:hypothetical protein